MLLDKVKNLRVRYYLELYNKSLNWSKDELENFQLKKTRDLLIYASKNVPFYKRRFYEADFNPYNFTYLDQLRSIPPLTRFDLQNNLKELLSPNINLRTCKKGSSSGSTGHPVTYYHDIDGISAAKAAVLFCKLLGGYKLGDSWINIWGNPTAVNIEWKKLSSRVSRILFKETRFPAYKLNTRAHMENLVEIFLKKKPKFIYGYTNAIFLLAEYLESQSIRTDFVKGIFTTAENLQDFQKVAIEKNIGKVFDHYGCSEISGIAVQTLFDEYYSVIEPHVKVEFGEIVDTNLNMRKILVTDFDNYVLPFIRYENGDLSVPVDDKNDNLKFGKIKSIDGRLSDIIKLPSGGNLIVPSFFGSRMLKNVNGIKQYQVVKYAPDRIRINLSINDYFDPGSRTIIYNTLKEYLPEDLKYDLVFNEKFLYAANNKFKLFIDQTQDK